MALFVLLNVVAIALGITGAMLRTAFYLLVLGAAAVIVNLVQLRSLLDRTRQATRRPVAPVRAVTHPAGHPAAGSAQMRRQYGGPRPESQADRAA